MWSNESDSSDSSVNSDDSSGDSSDSSSQDSNSVLDSWSLRSRGVWKALSQVSDLSSNNSDLLGESVNSLSEGSDNSSLSWSQRNWLSIDWLLRSRMSDVLNSSVQSGDSSGHLSDHSSQSSDLSGNSRSFWFWSIWKTLGQSVDGSSDHSDSLGQPSHSSPGGSDNGLLFRSDGWCWSWSHNVQDGVVASVSLGRNSSDLLLELSDLLLEVDSLVSSGGV